MKSKNNYRPRELDGCAVEASKPRAVVRITSVTVWQPLRGGLVASEDSPKDALCGTTNIGGFIRSKLHGDNNAATTAPDLHKRQSTRRKRSALTCQQALSKAQRKRDQYLAMANEQAAKPYYDGNATLSSSDVSRLFSDMAKALADAIEDIVDVDPVLRAQAAKKMRAKERKGYGVLRQINKKRGGVLPNHATGYIPGEPSRSAVKAYRGLAYIATKAVRLIANLEKASRKQSA